MATLDILRDGAVQATINIDERAVFTSKLMGEHRITVESISPVVLPVQIGDYIEHKGERYYLNTTPNLEKLNNVTYSYSFDFEGEIYYLFNKLFMDEGQADFSYHGTPNDFLLLLLTNINSVLPGWTVAEVDNGEARTLSFSNDSCRTALTKIAEAFEFEYRLSGKAIYLQQTVGAATTLKFEYGRGKGLYSIRRDTVDSKGIVTRVFGFGARTNIGLDYRDGSTRLVFEERSLENNVDLYGVREAAIDFDDIYPQRTGTVTAVDGSDIYQVTDSSLDFDIDDQLIEGTVAKIVFKTGALAGYEFEVKRYLNASKTIEFIPFQEDNGYELPNALNTAAIGDEYTLVDIMMPQSYIDAAELNLRERTQDYIDENSVPRVAYAIEIDEKYVKSQGIDLRVANLVTVVDADLGINAQIRVTEVSYPLVNENQVSALFSDTVPYTVQERLVAAAVDNNVLTKNVDRRRAELARRSTARLRQLQDLVFDPDGYFVDGNIRPQSVDTLLLSVGAKSQNFGLLGVTLQPNAGGDQNSFNISNGQLVHYDISIDGLGYVWDVDPQNFTNLDPAKPYYVYAKCSKTALTGIWELSEVPRPTEDEIGQYLFNLGILYPVADDRRDFDFTNGMTFISGDTITTGTIRSLDGLNFFDLAGGRFKIGNSTSSLDWNVTEPDKLTLRGSLIQTPAGDTVIIPNSRGAYSGTTNYFEGDVVTYNGNSYQNTTPAATIGVIPTNTSEWELFIEGGAQGPAGADGADGADGEDGAQGPAGADGEDGAQGPPGADGQDGPQGPQGVQGPIGPTGPSGAVGPAIVFRGIFASGTYYNNSNRRDVVLQSGIYYIFNGTNASTQSTFVSGNWENFGAQFVSVATDLLLAESANIADWIINNGQIVSQTQFNGDPVARLNGLAGELEFRNGITRYNTTGAALNNIPSSIDIKSGRIDMAVDAAGPQPAASLEIRPDRIKLTGAYGPIGSGGDVYTGGKMVGIEADVTARHPLILASDFLAAIYGRATNSNGYIAYGGYFEGLYMRGPFNEETRRISSNVTLTTNSRDYHLIHTGTNDITITMPSDPAVGRTFILKRSNSGDVFLNGNGKSFYRHQVQSGTGSLFIPVVGMGFRLTYDGVYWQYYQMWG